MTPSLLSLFSLFVIGLPLGAAIAWIISQKKNKTELATAQQALEEVALNLRQAEQNLRQAEQTQHQKEIEFVRLQERLQAQETMLAHQAHEFKEAINAYKERLEQQKLMLEKEKATHEKEKQLLNEKNDQLQYTQQQLSTEVTHLTTVLEKERKQTEEKIQLLQNAEEQLTQRFKNLANDILEDKTKRFTEQNHSNLQQLLEPLRLRINEFQGKVEEVYVQESKDRSALSEQVRHLAALNQQLSSEAHNLTKALKGQTKSQGNWGEMILERVLELSGLRKGYEYDTQESHTREDGSRAQPDVILHLPENKHLIIDAKVSLNAYELYVNHEDASQKEAAIKKHIESIRTHIKGLSERNYQKIYGLQSLDFVLMFIPIEPAFIIAISNDTLLWQEAWKKNVLLVSPSTLLFVVRTIAHLWRQEQLNQNAQEISKRGSELYDKFVGFVQDIDHIGKHLDKAQEAHQNAYKKLTDGRGNLTRQAQQLVKLGLKPTKQLPPTLVSLADDFDADDTDKEN
jgi:DNA recombination protein RmuC